MIVCLVSCDPADAQSKRTTYPETMSNDEDGSTLEPVVDDAADGVVRLRVDARGGLVHDEDLVLPQYGPREHHELFLPCAETELISLVFPSGRLTSRRPS